MPDLSAIARLAKRLLVLELRLYAAIGRWILRRRGVPDDTEPWGYGQLVTPVLWLWVFGGVVETIALHFIIPWEHVRLVVDILDVWGVIWMLGMLASYRVYPHLLAADELRVRNGVSHDVHVPLAAIASAAATEQDLPSSIRSLQLTDGDGGTHVSVGVSGRTNVTLRLDEPTLLGTAKGTVSAVAVSLWVDDPRAFTARIRSAAQMTSRR